MDTSVLTLDSPKIYVYRHLNPQGNIIDTAPEITMQSLAEMGLGLTNNKDRWGKLKFEWRDTGWGFKEREFRMPGGNWPVWITTSKEGLQEQLASDASLRSRSGFTYGAQIDLRELILGTNVDYEDSDEVGEGMTNLKLTRRGQGKFGLVAKLPLEKMQHKLTLRFDGQRRLLASGWTKREYYFTRYKDPSQLSDELIIQWVEGNPIDITAEVLEVRRTQQEIRAEIESDMNPGRRK
jgi:hypothetical protein